MAASAVRNGLRSLAPRATFARFLTMMEERKAKRRWPRTQRFVLSERGVSAAQAYMDDIVASRSAEGRSSYDAARTKWAQTYAIEPNDGLYLAEIKAGPIRLEHILAALESCGETRKDAIAALERLLDAGLITTALDGGST